MKRRHSARAYLTGEQRQHVARLFGCCRVVFNDFLAEARRQYTETGTTDFDQVAKHVTTLAKKTPERQWLTEVSSVALQQSIANAKRAYRNFFDSCSGKRKGRKVGFPKFKCRSGRQTATFTRNAGFTVRVDGCSKWGFVRLPGLGEVKFVVSADLDWESISSVTLIGNPDGTFEVSFTYEAAEVTKKPAPQGTVAGIDLGLTVLASGVHLDGEGDGERFDEPNERHLRRKQRALARAQKSLSRKEKGSRKDKRPPSANYLKQKQKVATLHSQVARTRKDQLDKFSLQVARENQTVCLETLSITGLARTRMAKSIHDAGWGMLVAMIVYKSAERGGKVARAGRWDPTTQRCSVCGHPGIGKLPLSVREWTCPGCGTLLDREFNAAVNIIDAAGLAESLNACGGDVRLWLAEAITREAGTHRTDPDSNVAAA